MKHNFAAMQLFDFCGICLKFLRTLVTLFFNFEFNLEYFFFFAFYSYLPSFLSYLQNSYLLQAYRSSTPYISKAGRFLINDNFNFSAFFSFYEKIHPV